MKLALSCSGLSHVRRGVETWSQEAFDALRQRGVDVTLFKGSGANTLDGVHVLPCIARGSPWSQRLGRVLPSWSWHFGLGSDYQMEQTTFALNLLPRVRRFDIVHTKDPHVAAMLQAARRAGLSRAKVILNHGTEEPPEFLCRFDYLQHLAPFHLEEARQQGVAARRQFVVPNFVDTDTFCPGSGAAVRAQLGIPQEAFVILCVAAIKRHHKRLDYLLAEAARVPSLPTQPVHVLVVGARTEQTDAMIRLGHELLGERARFLVDHPREQMPDVYRAADLFVLCSFKEMLANATLEALASGLPCVMHRDPVAQWAIGEGGDTIDMETPGPLTSAIETYRDASRRADASARARQQAEQRFATDVVMTQQMAMYREVLDDR